MEKFYNSQLKLPSWSCTFLHPRLWQSYEIIHGMTFHPQPWLHPLLSQNFLHFPPSSPSQTSQAPLLSLLSDPGVVSSSLHSGCDAAGRDWCSLTWHVRTLLVTCGIQQEKWNQQRWHVHKNRAFLLSSLAPVTPALTTRNFATIRQQLLEQHLGWDPSIFTGHFLPCKILIKQRLKT